MRPPSLALSLQTGKMDAGEGFPLGGFLPQGMMVQNIFPWLKSLKENQKTFP